MTCPHRPAFCARWSRSPIRRGTILIGVEDRTAHVRGVENPLDVEERAANLISDSVRPRLLPDLQILTFRNLQVLAVHVHPSRSAALRSRSPRSLPRRLDPGRSLRRNRQSGDSRPCGTQDAAHPRGRRRRRVRGQVRAARRIHRSGSAGVVQTGPRAWDQSIRAHYDSVRSLCAISGIARAPSCHLAGNGIQNEQFAR